MTSSRRLWHQQAHSRLRRRGHPLLACFGLLGAIQRQESWALKSKLSFWNESHRLACIESNRGRGACLFLGDKTNHSTTASRSVWNFSFAIGLATRTKRRRRSMSLSGSKILQCPAAERNKEVIWNILKQHVLLPRTDDANAKLKVLEIAAGSGVHTVHFLTRAADAATEDDEKKKTKLTLYWQPADMDKHYRDSVDEQCQPLLQDKGLSDAGIVLNLPTIPLTLDENGWVEKSTSDMWDVMICINMIHIAPWEAGTGLIKFASQQLNSGGRLYIYGPFYVNGETADSNRAFDASLRQRDPSWGVRELQDVIRLGQEHGLSLESKHEMPSNNLSVIFQKGGALEK